MALTISIEQRIKLLKYQSLFVNLAAGELNDLAQTLREEHFLANQVIVTQGELVESFYIIAKGKSVVTRRISEKDCEKDQTTTLATLSSGETIGLSERGFYSKTGVRTATVTTLQESILLTTTLKDFQLFLQRYPKILPTMQNATTNILRMRLIKQVLPFAAFNPEELLQIAKELQEIKVAAGTILFHQDDIGDCAYLIEEGEIEILNIKEDGSEFLLTTLRSPNIFGEAAILMNTPRSATAKASKECSLLMINHEQMEALSQSNIASAQAFAMMIIERSRPMRKTGITPTIQKNAEQETIVTLKDTENKSYYKLSEAGFFVWQQMDGLKSMRDITLLFLQKFDQFSPQILSALVLDLAHTGFITIKGLHIPAENTNQSIWAKAGAALTKVMEVKYTINNIDSFIGSLYQRCKFLYSNVGLIILFLLGVSGMIAFALAIPSTIKVLDSYPHALLIPLVIAIDILALPFAFIHELGHALTTKHYGRDVNGMGFGWYWLGPIAFCDTSDLWLSPKWPRIIVNSAGMAIDAVRAGIFAWLALLVHIPAVQLFCWLFALGTYSAIFANLNPIIELDGYYILSDWMEETKLRENAVVWVTDILPVAIKKPSLLFKYPHEILFWMICLCHILIGAVLAWLTQHYIVSIIFPAMAKSYWSWILPFIVIILALSSVRSQIKQVKNVDY